MANVPVVQFIFVWKGDGSSTSISIDLKDGPMQYRPAQVSYVFMKDVATNISGVDSLSCDNGLTVAFNSVSHGILTLDVTSGTVANGQYYTVTGNLLF